MTAFFAEQFEQAFQSVFFWPVIILAVIALLSTLSDFCRVYFGWEIDISSWFCADGSSDGCGDGDGGGD